MFLDIQKDRDFIIYYGREDEKITIISEKYNDVFPGDKLAIFGENEQLQIAINKGTANTLLGLKLHEIIRIEFK
jgi:S-adenosylmethionine hydrolase